MERQDQLSVPLKISAWALSTAIASLVLVVVVAVVAAEFPAVATVGGLVVLLALFLVPLAMLIFYAALYKLVYRMGLSVPIWVGLPFITSPIGPVVAYLLIRKKVADESRTARK